MRPVWINCFDINLKSALRNPKSAILALLFALSFPAEAQQAKRVYRIGFVSATSPGPPIDALRQGLTKLGSPWELGWALAENGWNS